ncbi:hypothetical protein XA68_17631 [Ophiocordyceps unilateralis]|uniref:Aromatic prenyltransferase (DMATS family) n=1 Tax=Ophiocordyceps unilateralis TaxID=268505 RepID=A0A2A9PIX1_OPHUN|nr:hypothetical protein XA68_17631 [Ophiocordyceps unilateralis]
MAQNSSQADRTSLKPVIEDKALSKHPLSPPKKPTSFKSSVWDTLSSQLPSRSPECDYWWNLTGMHLARMVEGAGYPIEKQHEALLFHYHWMVPAMGPAPSPQGTLDWPSILNVDGTPIEYSWRWNTRTNKPVIRYAIEAKNEYTGTAVDPLNQDASRKLLYGLQKSFPGIDLTWTNHFLSTLFHHDESKYVEDRDAKGTQGTTMMVSTELKPSDFIFKTYFLPRIPGVNPIPIGTWKEAVSAVSPTGASRALYNFLEGPHGKSLSPLMLAVDAVKPEGSRLKFYFTSSSCSFNSIRETMTLGGLIPIPKEHIQELRSLVSAVAGVEPDFPDDCELPLSVQPDNDPFSDSPLSHAGCVYHFDIGPGRDFPDVKFYFNTFSYGADDLSIARAVTDWMDKRGRGEYSQGYLSMLECLPSRRRLGEGKGVHSWLSCLFAEDGQLEVTSYTKPEI